MSQPILQEVGNRIPSLMDVTTRVYGITAYLFGINPGKEDFNALCDEVGAHEYERRAPLSWDGLKILPRTMLEPGQIDAVVFVPNQLIVRKTTLEQRRTL